MTESLSVQTAGFEPPRGFFWQPAPGADVWVHYGFTGTAMWISPQLGRWATLLTNKLLLQQGSQRLMDLRDTFRENIF